MLALDVVDDLSDRVAPIEVAQELRLVGGEARAPVAAAKPRPRRRRHRGLDPRRAGHCRDSQRRADRHHHGPVGVVAAFLLHPQEGVADPDVVAVACEPCVRQTMAAEEGS